MGFAPRVGRVQTTESRQLACRCWILAAQQTSGRGTSELARSFRPNNGFLFSAACANFRYRFFELAGARGRTCVETARADQPVVIVLFDDVRAPTADSGAGKKRRV